MVATNATLARFMCFKSLQLLFGFCIRHDKKIHRRWYWRGGSGHHVDDVVKEARGVKQKGVVLLVIWYSRPQPDAEQKLKYLYYATGLHRAFGDEYRG